MTTPNQTLVSTHSRSKAAASGHSSFITSGEFQLTAARRRLRVGPLGKFGIQRFQLTAARRRLRLSRVHVVAIDAVSTHSRSKAAACNASRRACCSASFNSQPLEGGCMSLVILVLPVYLFQLTAARRRLRTSITRPSGDVRFQLTAARRRLHSLCDMDAPYLMFQLTAARRRLHGTGTLRTR